MPKTRLERLADDAVRGDDPIARARKLKRAQANPQYARALAAQGQHQRKLSRQAQAIAAKLQDREAFEAAARRQGAIELARAEAQAQELRRVQAIVAQYDAIAKQTELRQKDAAAHQRYFPQAGVREEF